jgi:hypothetical protein
MLNRCFLLLLLVCLTQSVEAQIRRSRIETYYRLVNNAELAITEQKFADALQQYRAAAKHRTPFAYDAHNAVLCAAETGDYDVATDFAEVLLNKGVPAVFFDQAKFGKLAASKTWRQYLQRRTRRGRAPKLDTALRTRLDSLLALDQKFRSNNLLYADSIARVDSIINLELRSIFSRFGYPSEERVGVYMTNDSTFYLTAPIDFLLIHMMKNGHRDMIPRLLEFVHSGDMAAVKLVTLSAYFGGDPAYIYGCNNNNQVVIVQIKDELYTCSEEKEALVNKNRANIYLESVADLKRKIDYNFRVDKRFKLNVSYAISILDPYSPNLDKIRARLLENQLVMFKKLPNSDPYIK